MKYAIVTLGCKVNQFETEAMEALFRDLGHRAAGEDEVADAVIVNTCSVTAESGRKSRQAVRRLMARHPGAVSAVCGCFSQLEPEEVRALGADLVYGSGDRAGLVEAVVAAVEKRGEDHKALTLDDPFSRRVIEPLRGGSLSGRTRALLKIQDGCDNFCTYCVIPYARGRVRSLPPADAAAEAARLSQEGYRELIITGIEIASYGKDLPGRPRLAEAVTAIAEAAPAVRLRLGSLEPTAVTEDFCTVLKRLPLLCRHFHLSLQSGCDDTLKRMGRKYDTARFFESVERLRAHFPGCGLTADLIVGFPGESEEDFEATLNFIRRCAFSSMHIFPYSVRTGTRAAAMEGQLDKAVKANRAKRAQAAADQMEDDFLQKSVGLTLPVLFETPREDLCAGHSDTYCLVGVKEPICQGIVKNVQITGVQGKMLVGNAI